VHLNITTQGLLQEQNSPGKTGAASKKYAVLALAAGVVFWAERTLAE